MMRLSRRFILQFFLLCLSVSVGQAATETNPEADIVSYLYSARDYYKTVDNYTCHFTRQERLDGKLGKPETIFLKFQKPFRVYMKWIKQPFQGRELIFVPGQNDNRLKVHIGGLLNLILPSFNIAIDNPRVLKSTRHPITNAGYGNMINSLIDQFELAREQGDLEVTILGTEEIDGVACIKIERVLPPDKGYYCHRLLLFLNAENKVPVRVLIYDWNSQLIESYTYTKVVWNAGLSEKDFDASNKDYGFGIF